jgi:hypothetical protein
MSKILDIKGVADVTDFDIRADETISMKTGGIEHASINAAGTFTISNTNSSLSVTSGALVISGGIGIGQNINVDNDVNVGGILTLGINSTSGYSFPSTIGSTGNVLSVSTDGSLIFGAGGTDSVTASQDFGSDNRMVRTVDGNKEIEATSIIITDEGGIIIDDATPADGITSGALLVSGGISTGQNLDIGTTLEVGTTSELNGAVSMGSTLNVTGNSTMVGELTISNTTDSTSISSGALKVSGGVGIAKDVYIGGNLNVDDEVRITNTNVSSDSSTGALIVTGGLGVGGKINTEDLDVNQSLDVSGTSTLNELSVTNNMILGGNLNMTGNGSTAVFGGDGASTATFSGTLMVASTSDSSSSTSSGALVVNGGALIKKNLVIGGNLLVEGQTTTVNSTTTAIIDPMFKVADGNPADTYDFGFYGEYRVGNDGTFAGTLQYSGLHRVGNDSLTTLPEIAGKWILFDSGSTEPGPLNVGDAGTAADLVVGGLVSTTLQIKPPGEQTTSSGSITLDYPDLGTDYTLVFPSAQGSASNVLINDGTGILSWGNPTADPNFSVPVSITDATDSVSVSTGALKVSGGVGIVKDVYIGGNLNVNDEVRITNTNGSTDSSTGALIVSGGMGVNGRISTEELNVALDSTMTGTLIINGVTGEGDGLSVSNGIYVGTASTMNGTLIIGSNTTMSGTLSVTGGAIFYDPTVSSSSITGALQVKGGVGISKELYVGGVLSVGGDSTMTGTLIINGSGTGLDILNGLNVGGDSTMDGTLIIGSNTTMSGTLSVTGGGIFHNATNSTTTNSGALQVVGGVGIGLDVFVGGKMNITGNSTMVGTLGVTGDTSITNLSHNGRISGKVRTIAGATSLDDDYILNVSALATITLPDVTDAVYTGVTYMVVKTTASTVTIDTGNANSEIFQTSGNVDSLDMTGISGERIMLISNGTNWYTM